MTESLRKQILDTSRGRIVSLLQRGSLTADDIAFQLGLTRSAIRIQMAAMERDGVVRRVGKRPGTTRPSHLFALTPEVEQLLSKAYIPLLMQLVRVFSEALPADQLDDLLRKAGEGLADDLSRGKRLPASVRSRVAMVSEMMNDQLGATTRVEVNGGYVIRGAGCPLAALTGKNPGVCLAMERLVSEIVGVPAHECCDRTASPRCCFEIHDQRRQSARQDRRPQLPS